MIFHHHNWMAEVMSSPSCNVWFINTRIWQQVWWTPTTLQCMVVLHQNWMVNVVNSHHCTLYGVVLHHHPAGCEHLLTKVREHVCVQIREHLVVMPCDVCPTGDVHHMAPTTGRKCSLQYLSERLFPMSLSWLLSVRYASATMSPIYSIILLAEVRSSS